MLNPRLFNPVQFGAGHRSCLGKNISLLEIYKVVPTLLRRFDVSTLSPENKDKPVNLADWRYETLVRALRARGR